MGRYAPVITPEATTGSPKPPIRPLGAGVSPCSRARSAEAAADCGLAFLIQHYQVAFDLLLAVLLDLVGDFAGAGDDVARPYAGGEADLEAADVADSDVGGDGFREQPRRKHVLCEDRRDSGCLDESLIVMQWDEGAGC